MPHYPREAYDHPPRRLPFRSSQDDYNEHHREAWVTRVDKHDPRMQTGIRYFPETDTFSIPPKRNRGGTYEPAK